MNVEQVLAVAVPVAVLMGPLFAILFSIQHRLSRIEQRLDSEARRADEILARHDKSIHEIRNSLHAIALQVAVKKGSTE